MSEHEIEIKSMIDAVLKEEVAQQNRNLVQIITQLIEDLESAPRDMNPHVVAIALKECLKRIIG